MFHTQINWNFQCKSSTPRSLKIKKAWLIDQCFGRQKMSDDINLIKQRFQRYAYLLLILNGQRSQYCWIKIITYFSHIRIMITVNIFTNVIVYMASHTQNCLTYTNLTVKSMKHEKQKCMWRKISSLTIQKF